MMPGMTIKYFLNLRRGFILTRYSPKAVTQMLGYGICIKDSNVTALIRELTCLITIRYAQVTGLSCQSTALNMLTFRSNIFELTLIRHLSIRHPDG